MFHSSQYPRSRLFGGEGSRSKASMESASHSIRHPSNHPPSIVAPEYPNIEMLEASQLSMDSDLRAYSQSSNFVDVPLGQPSASMSSFSSSHEQRYYPNTANHHHSSHYNNDGEGRGSHRSTMPQMSQSSFSGGSIKSSLRTKTNDKTKKTRFASVRDSRGLRSRRASSQGSYAPLSQSSSNSQEGSQCTSRSSRRIQLQRPPSKIHAMNDPRSLHSGRRSSNYIPQRQQNSFVEEPSAYRKGSKNQKLSPTAGLQEPMFSRIATPLKPINIPYPPIKFHPRNKRPSPVQPTKRQELYGCDVDPKNGMSNFRNDTERALCEAKHAGAPRTFPVNGATKQSENAQELYEDNEQGIFTEAAMNDAGATQNAPSSANASANGNSSNIENQRMDSFKTNLEKLLSETKAVQEELKGRLGEAVATIQEASKSNLDRIEQKRDEAETAIETLHESTKTQLEEATGVSLQNVRACTETGLSKIKKFTESWLSTSCNAIANRLKPYLGSSMVVDVEKTSTGDIECHTPINQEHRKASGSVLDSAEKNRSKRKSQALLGGSSKTRHDAERLSSSGSEMSRTQLSGGTSQGDCSDKTSARPLRRSKRTKQRNDQKGDTNTSKNATSITSSTTTTPRAEKQQTKRSPTGTSHAKNGAEHSKTTQPLKGTKKKSERTLCVTPTEGTSRSLKKDRTKPTTSSSSSKKSKAENNKLKPIRSKRRKRQKTPSLSSTKKRLKTNGESSQTSVPSEVVAFSDVQLSPLEGPNLFSFPYAKPKVKSLQPFGKKKRKSTPPRIYGRKKKTFDVMDNNDVFCF